MTCHTITDALLELLAPTRCAGCERPGSVLCDWCVEEIMRYRTKHLCPRCGTPFGELVCTECQDKEYAFERVICLGELDGPLSRAVVIYKDAFEKRLGPVLGELLAMRCIGALSDNAIDAITWIPPTRHALKQRGYDHAAILAECVARALGLRAQQHLARCATRDLRTLTRQQRIDAARDSYRYRDECPDLSGQHLLIVDDVLTTATTLNGAAQMLLSAGARTITGAVLARAW